MQVDYVGHSWVFKTEWVRRYFWREYQPTWEACEDMALSATSWIHGRIRTIVPPMPDNRYEVMYNCVIINILYM